MERTGIVDWMDERLLDPRNPLLITYPLADWSCPAFVDT